MRSVLNSELARAGLAGAFLLAACRLEPLAPDDGAGQDRGGTIRGRQGPTRTDSEMMVIGLTGDDASLERATLALCRAARAGVDPELATYQALRTLECEQRVAQGRSFAEALLMAPDGRWGAAARIPEAYLAADAALGALRARGGLVVGPQAPLSLADCELARARPAAESVGVPVELDGPGAEDAPLAIVEQDLIDLVDGLPEHGDEGDEGVEGDEAHGAHEGGERPGQPDDDGGVAPPLEGALGAGPAPGPAPSQASPPAAEHEPGYQLATGGGDEARMLGLLWRDEAGALHGGLLSTGRPPASAPTLPAGFDVLPGQHLQLGPDAGALVELPTPHDPATAAAPAAAALDARARAALPWSLWVLPRRGPPHAHAPTPRAGFFAQACPSSEPAASFAPDREPTP